MSAIVLARSRIAHKMEASAGAAGGARDETQEDPPPIAWSRLTASFRGWEGSGTALSG